MSRLTSQSVIIKDFLDESQFRLIDKNTDPKLFEFKESSLKKENLLPYEQTRYHLTIEGKPLMMTVSGIGLHPKLFHFSDSEPKRLLLNLNHVREALSQSLNIIQTACSQYLEKTKEEYEKVVYTREEKYYQEIVTQKSYFSGLLTRTQKKKLEKTRTVTYNKDIQETELHIRLQVGFNYLTTSSQTKSKSIQINCSIDDQTLEQFIDKIKKTDKYQITLSINGLTLLLLNQRLAGFVNFRCLKISKLEDHPPPYIDK